MTKCGYVTILGIPNAGKSTLMNRMLGINLSIVTHKAQTTRNKILGIYSDEDVQIIFHDTPGVILPKYEMHSFMMKEVTTSINDADVVLHLLDVSLNNLEEQFHLIEPYLNSIRQKKVITVLNKCDLIEQHLLEIRIESIKRKLLTPDVIPISAVSGFNTGRLLEELKLLLPESPFMFDPDEITDKPEKFFVAEILRQKILEMFKEEIPYSVFVDIVEFKERENNKDYISAEIILERETQKIIVIGKGGSMLKRLGKEARQSIEKFLDREVYLELFVKVRKNWRKNEDFLKRRF